MGDQTCMYRRAEDGSIDDRVFDCPEAVPEGEGWVDSPDKIVDEVKWQRTELQRETLKLKLVINLARNTKVDDWPPPEHPWRAFFQDLKHAIDSSELAATPRDTRAAFYSRVALPDLWRFVERRDARWQPIRELCERWAAVRGEELTGVRIVGADAPLEDAGAETATSKLSHDSRGKGAADDGDGSPVPKGKTTFRPLSPEDEAKLTNRIESVVAVGRRLHRGQSKAGLAALLIENGQAQGFKKETLKQILLGTYPPMKKRGMSGL